MGVVGLAFRYETNNDTARARHSHGFSITNSWLTYAASFGLVLIAGGGLTALVGVIVAAAAQWIVLIGLAELSSALPSSGVSQDGCRTDRDFGLRDLRASTTTRTSSRPNAPGASPRTWLDSGTLLRGGRTQPRAPFTLRYQPSVLWRCGILGSQGLNGRYTFVICCVSSSRVGQRWRTQGAIGERGSNSLHSDSDLHGSAATARQDDQSIHGSLYPRPDTRNPCSPHHGPRELQAEQFARLLWRQRVVSRCRLDARYLYRRILLLRHGSMYALG